jgi:hypothetical protein
MLFPERVRGSIRVMFYVAAFIKSQELCEMEQVHFFDWHADKCCCLPHSLTNEYITSVYQQFATGSISQRPLSTSLILAIWGSSRLESLNLSPAVFYSTANGNCEWIA